MTNLQTHITNIKNSRNPSNAFHTLALAAKDKITLLDGLIKEENVFDNRNCSNFLGSISTLIEHHPDIDLANDILDLLMSNQKKMAHFMKENAYFSEILLNLIQHLFRTHPEKTTALLLNKTGRIFFYQKIQNLFLDNPSQFNPNGFNAYLHVTKPLIHSSFSPFRWDNPEYITLITNHYEILHIAARYDQNSQYERARIWQKLIDLYESNILPFERMKALINHSLAEKTDHRYATDSSEILFIQQFVLENLRDEHFNELAPTTSFPWNNYAHPDCFSLSFLIINKWIEQENNPSEETFNKILLSLEKIFPHLFTRQLTTSLISSYIKTLENLEIKMRPHIRKCHEKIENLFTITSCYNRTFSASFSTRIKDSFNTEIILKLITSGFLSLAELDKLKNWKRSFLPNRRGKKNRIINQDVFKHR